MDANTFSFSNAKFDYYLSKDSDGASTLRTTEQLTAEFPDYDQNHGIERCIPNRYRGVESLDESSFSVRRNGDIEPFTSYENEGLTCFRIGSASSYVHGQNTYEISYTAKNVILDPDNSNNQEFYWDTNGTGWAQPFEQLNATVHLDTSIASAFLGNPSCYVGVQGTSGLEATSRCQTFVSKDNSEVIFTTSSLNPRENLTLNLEFSPETFSIAKPHLTPVFYIALIALIIPACLLFFNISSLYKAYQLIKPKRELSKAAKPVQYLPPEKLPVAVAAKSWLKPCRNLYVATLMELAVSHRIELERGEKKLLGGYKWKIHVKDIDGIHTHESKVLEILNYPDVVSSDTVIEVKRHSSTSRLQSLGLSFDASIASQVKNRGLQETEKANRPHFVGIILSFFGIFMFGAPLIDTLMTELTTSGLTEKFGFITPLAGFGALFVAMYFILFVYLLAFISKYSSFSIEGIKMSNYLDGLKEYISLAETERIKFLHSVNTADTSPQGIVKLYEKLLPYAIIFGLEESWMKEMNKYYEMDTVDNPDWMMGAIYLSSSDFRTFTTQMQSTVSSSVASESSSSSGSSGGGGGGSSGGGGGGGGGGGW